MSEPNLREVTFSGRTIKLTDLLKQAGLADNVPMGGNVKFLVETGGVAVDGEISGTLGRITKRTKLGGGEIITRFGLTDDPDDERIIARDREEGAFLSDRYYRYPAEIVRAVTD
jgi:ribosome-associated protein YbcJ (S4-like RNA binding protein)